MLHNIDVSPDDLKRAGLTRSTSYELFVLAVSLLSFINIVLFYTPIGPQELHVVLIVDWLTSLVFLGDFLLRWGTASNKHDYFFHNYGWSDMLAAVPVTAFNLLRIFRVLKFFRAVRYIGFRGLFKLMRNKPSDTALYSIFFMILLLLEFGSIGVLLAEQHAPGANIKTASDAIWWVFVSITTVGYGDYFPVSNAGRLVGVLTISVGIGLFGVVTGYLSKIFLRERS